MDLQKVRSSSCNINVVVKCLLLVNLFCAIVSKQIFYQNFDNCL